MGKKNRIAQSWCGLGYIWKKKMKERNKKQKTKQHWSCSCSQWGSPIRAENNLYFISLIFRKLPWTQGWPSGQLCPEMPEAIAISAPLSEASKMKHFEHSFKGVKAWNWHNGQLPQHFPFFCTAFCFPCLLFRLSVPWFWQFFKCLLKELWQPGRENWNVFLGSLYLEVKKAEGKNNCMQKSWESWLRQQTRWIWQRGRVHIDALVGRSVTGCNQSTSALNPLS